MPRDLLPAPGLGRRSGRALLLVALGFGLLADVLLRVRPWGLNLTAAVFLLVAAAAVFSRWHGIALEGGGRWLVVPVLFFAGALAWRDSPTLTTGNSIALATTLLLAAASSRAGKLRVAGLSQYTQGAATTAIHALAGLAPVLGSDIGWHSLARFRGSRVTLAFARGVVLALPPLLVFGALFEAADANFERIVNDLFNVAVDLDDLVVRATLATGYAWLFAGLVRGMLLARQSLEERPHASASQQIGIVEIGTMLTALNLLFLGFVLVQVRYLFGGVEQALEVGFSQYARRGFFELVWVAGLTLPLLLVSHWVLRKDSPKAERVFRVLAGVLVGLLFVVVASAVMRIRLSVEDTGLSELRVQASAFLAWVAVVLVWFLLTVLRGHRRRFAFGALVSAFLTLGVLNVLNPDELIVRNNAAYGHFVLEGPFVGRSLASFSADTAPAIVDALPTIDAEHRPRIEARLKARWCPSPRKEPDWRTFNWSRSYAYAAVARHAGGAGSSSCPAQPV